MANLKKAVLPALAILLTASSAWAARDLTLPVGNINEDAAPGSNKTYYVSQHLGFRAATPGSPSGVVIAESSITPTNGGSVVVAADKASFTYTAPAGASYGSTSFDVTLVEQPYASEYYALWTGIDNNRAVLPGNTVDPHWQVSFNGGALTAVKTIASSPATCGQLATWGGAWLNVIVSGNPRPGELPVSITTANGNCLSGPGNFVYQTSFQVGVPDLFDAGFRLMSDNRVTGIEINGVALSATDVALSHNSISYNNYGAIGGLNGGQGWFSNWGASPQIRLRAADWAVNPLVAGMNTVRILTQDDGGYNGFTMKPVSQALQGSLDDDDGDGVPNALDQCPDSPAGSTVETDSSSPYYGCAKQVVRVTLRWPPAPLVAAMPVPLNGREWLVVAGLLLLGVGCLCRKERQ